MRESLIYISVLIVLLQLVMCSCGAKDNSNENILSNTETAEQKADGEFIGEYERGNELGKMNIYANSDRYIYIYDENLSPVQSIQLFSEMDTTSIIENFRAEDINFDGYTDIGVINTLGTSNAYYDYYLWNNEAGSFSYYHPLSEISSPVVRNESKTVYSYSHNAANSFSEYEYRWVNGELVMLTDTETVYDSEGNGKRTVKSYNESGEEISSVVEDTE